MDSGLHFILMCLQQQNKLTLNWLFLLSLPSSVSPCTWSNSVRAGGGGGGDGEGLFTNSQPGRGWDPDHLYLVRLSLQPLPPERKSAHRTVKSLRLLEREREMYNYLTYSNIRPRIPRMSETSTGITRWDWTARRSGFCFHGSITCRKDFLSERNFYDYDRSSWR